MDIRRILGASTTPIIIGLVLLLLKITVQIIPSIISNLGIIGTLLSIFGYLTVLLFAIIYAWAALRASSKYKMDLHDAGMVSATSYLVVGIVGLFINFVLSFLLVNLSLGGYSSAESLYSSALFGSQTGVFGVITSGICGIGILVLGVLLNFVIGSFAVMFSGKAK